MKIKYSTLFLLISQFLFAQQKSDWQTYLAYNNAQQVEEAYNHVFVLADNALYGYSAENSEITLYSKQNGLNDTEINIIKYNPDNNVLVIVYSNGNIDLLDKDGVTNMPDLKNALNIQSKGVYDVFFKSGLAYLSTDFGLIVLNLDKKEVKETYKLDMKVASASIAGEKIYAATEKGIYQADTKTNLLDKSNWSRLNMPNMENIVRLCLFDNQIVVCRKGAGLYYFSPASTEEKTLLNHGSIKNISVEANELLAHSDNEIYMFKTLDGSYGSMNTETVNDITSLKEDGKYWIAAGTSGLVGIRQTGNNEFTKFVSGLQINSPESNYDYFMTVYNNDKLLITGGGRMLARFDRPGILMTYKDNHWYNFDENIVNQQAMSLINTKVSDYMCAAVAPDDENHYYIGTYGEGIVELKNNEFVNIFSLNNSTLESAIPDNKNFVRIGHLVFDKNKNLWVVNGNVRNTVNVLKSDGTWSSLYYQPISYADKVDKILITSRGHKWLNVPYNNAGIFVFDDKGTIDDISDDTYNFFGAFKDTQSNTGSMITASEYLSMAEDKTGTIWVGTNTGLLKCTSPSRAIDNPDQLAFSRLVREDAYFLNGESVTAIAVDADNNKWIGTGSSGVFLINEDGSETIYDFTTENSPLLSNTIQSIAINNNTGEVFFGTNKGLISFNSGVRNGSVTFSNVYAFPNPVRPDFDDKVTITGLSNNTNVKITDISGNLLYQARVLGNRLVWNCRNLSGNRVATGIYLVIASTSDASESIVAKIAVVK
jgi:ligand-binding sensor domain-containing protein